MKTRKIFTLDEEVIKELHSRRDLIPASAYLNNLLRKLWGMPVGEEPQPVLESYTILED